MESGVRSYYPTQNLSGKINNMEAILFALCLEVAVLQMRILEGSIQIRSMLLKPNDNWNKLAQERALVTRVLRRTLVEVAESGGWSTLQQTVQNLALHSATLMEQQSRSEKLYTSCKDLIKELRTKRRQWSRQLRIADHTIAVLKDKKKDALLNASLRLCYADKWLCARAESLELKFQVPRPPLPRIDHENIVHSDMLKFFELQIKEKESAVEYWRVKYTNDIAVISQLTVKKQEQWLAVRARREELQKLYDDHESEIQSWLNVKRERSERLAEEERRTKAATRIQSWWRGVMVRRGLGAFKFLKNVKKPSAKGKKK